jgi:hypothetical protein
MKTKITVKAPIQGLRGVLGMKEKSGKGGRVYVKIS